MEKSFKDISLNITEEEYRNDGCMHYSTLAKYERGGFDSISTLFDRVESPSLLLGSLVDCLLTGSEEEFDSLYVVADFPTIGEKELSIVKQLFSLYKETYPSLIDIDDKDILSVIEEIGFQSNWKPETRIKVIKERCSNYYDLLQLAEGKTLVASDMYATALQMVDAFKTSPATSFYFAADNPFDSVERLYQLKFAQEFEGIKYSCMADLIVVLHDQKLVIPCDIKTSSHYEYDFPKSFKDWNYQIQARSYWRQIRATMDKDPYFKDFELADYRFIVCNKKTLNPLVWECPFTKVKGDITVGKNKDIVLRDPFTIAKELNYYLQNQSVVPQGISLTDPNNLKDWLDRL